MQNKHVSCAISPRVPAGSLQSFKGRSLKVPEDIPETLKSCLCINVECTILMRVLAQTGTGMVMKLPLVIAGGPFHEMKTFKSHHLSSC